MNVELDGYDVIKTGSATNYKDEAQFRRKNHLEMPVTDISATGIGYHIDTE